MKTKEYFNRNKLLQTIHFNDRSGSKEGSIKIYPSNSYLHERIKFDIAYKLKKLGFDIWSECRFYSGGKADLIAIKFGKGYIIEVLCSETEEKFLSKKEKYPSAFEIIKIDADNFKIEDFKL